MVPYLGYQQSYIYLRGLGAFLKRLGQGWRNPSTFLNTMSAFGGDFVKPFCWVYVLLAPLYAAAATAELDSSHHFKQFPIESAKIVSPPIPGLANEDGTGLFWELMRTALEPFDVRIHINDMRLKTGVKMLSRYRSIDVVLGAQEPLEGTLLSFYPLLEISVSVMHPKGYELESILGTRRAPILLYKDLLLPKQLEEHKRIKICSKLKLCYSHLKKRKSVALFFNPANIRKKSHLQLSGYQVTAMPRPMLIYALFRDDAQGTALKKLIDLQLMELNRSGEMAKLYDKWHQGLPTLYLRRQQPDWL
jgi:polar amino acid transport system substrate-binding protein